jgi:excisionase family DNA binding protein
MAREENNNPTPDQDPLTIGELISLQEAAEYAGLTYKTLLTYARKGRLRAKRIGWMWVTTKASIDEYMASRSLENIPHKYRNRS